MGRKTRILIVDRDKSAADLLNQQFVGESVHVFSVDGVHEARMALSHVRPDIAIIDPTVEHGMDLLDHILRSEEAIAVIGRVDSEWARARLAGMCVESVKKDEGIGPLVQAVYNYLDLETDGQA